VNTISQPLLTAIVALAAAIMGGLVQAWWNRSFERQKFVRDQKRELYSSFLSALAKLSIYIEGSVDHLAAKALMAEVRCRIGLYGSPAVIRAVAAIFDFSDLTTIEGQAVMAKAVAAMREDSGASLADVTSDQLSSLVFRRAKEAEAP